MSPVEIWGKIILIPFFIMYIILLSRLRYSTRKTLLLSALIITLYTAVTYLIIWKLNYLIYIYPIWDVIYRYINVVIMMLFSLLLTRQRLAQTVFVTASVLVCISVVGVLAMLILQYTGMPELPTRVALHSLIALLLLWARKPFTEFLGHTKRGWWFLCAVPIVLIVTFLFVTSFPVSLERNPANMPAALTICVSTVIVYAAIVFTLRGMRKENELELNVISLRHFVTALEHQYALINQNAGKLAVFRHDLRHTTQMMSACADRGDMDGIRELLTTFEENLGNKTSPGTIASITGHKLLDAMLSFYVELAKEHHIDFTLRIGTIGTIPADMNELAVVLSNALENAFQACKKLSPEMRRVIRLNGERRGEQFFIEIANTCNGAVDFDSATGLPISREQGHGLGSQSIAFFAQKYNAILQYRLEVPWFYLRLLI